MTKTEDAERELAESVRVRAEDTGPEAFPYLRTISPVDFWAFQPVPKEAPRPPEIVALRQPSGGHYASKRQVAFEAALTEWNMLWESGPLRAELLGQEAREGGPRWSGAMRKVIAAASRANADVQFAVGEYGLLMTVYHLLPAAGLLRAGLPLLKPWAWPRTPWGHRHHLLLPVDFRERLSRAFAEHVWKLLSPRTPASALAPDSSVRLLAHNLEFWVPYVELAIQRRAKARGRIGYDDGDPDELARRHRRLRRSLRGESYTAERPLRWGCAWMGEEEAWEATEQTVELADAHGHLRALLDVFASHRVREDFSDHWSWAREDFERKLYGKRNKVKISFVEIGEAAPVHSSHSEVLENLLWSDLFALMDARERRVLVCLRKGETRVGDIAKLLGYANHSPVSKALARIRAKVRALLN